MDRVKTVCRRNSLPFGSNDHGGKPCEPRFGPRPLIRSSFRFSTAWTGCRFLLDGCPFPFQTVAPERRFLTLACCASATRQGHRRTNPLSAQTAAVGIVQDFPTTAYSLQAIAYLAATVLELPGSWRWDRRACFATAHAVPGASA